MDLVPPNIEGLTWRPVSPEDVTSLAALAEECWQTDGGLQLLIEPENLKGNIFLEGPRVSLGGFDAQGHLAAAVTLHLLGGVGKRRGRTIGYIRPDLRGKGLGTYLEHWSEAQARALTPAGENGELRLQITAESFTEPSRQFYLSRGYVSTMDELVMQRDLTQPLADHSFPPDVSLATWGQDNAAQFFEAYENAFRARPGFPGYSAQEWISDYMENESLRWDWSLLALAGDVPAGFVCCSTERPGAYLIQVGVVPEQRRRGLASALMAESMRRMQADGTAAVELTVHVNNPGAIQCYEELGYFTVGRRARFERLIKL